MEISERGLSIGELVAEAFELASRVTRDPRRAARLAADLVADVLSSAGRRDLVLELVGCPSPGLSK